MQFYWETTIALAIIYLHNSEAFSTTHSLQPNIPTAAIQVLYDSRSGIEETTTVVVNHEQSVNPTTTASATTSTSTSSSPPPGNNNINTNTNVDRTYWKIAPTFCHPSSSSSSLTPELLNALETNTHPIEDSSTLGKGRFLLTDWRRNWHTYESPLSTPDLIDPETGYAEYEVEVEGELPDDLVGVLYRNGPGKFGVGGERVAHTLDADGLIMKVTIPPPSSANNGEPRKVTFQSRFVETIAFIEEREAQKFLYRGTFGTAPRGPDWLFGKPERRGLNEDPDEPSLASKVAANAFKTDIKNNSNTQIISFGGKLLSLFEAGLPHAIDPNTLETLGEDDMGGTISNNLPVKLGIQQLDELAKDIIGGAAHTAHPNVCPRTGHLVGWSWAQLPLTKSMEVTFTEYSPENFESVATSTFEVPGCELAPHDMALTDDCILFKVNALTMEMESFITGISGPAAALKMDGRANVHLHVFPRPTSKRQFKPYEIELPPCFSIHFSHAYEDAETGNIVTYFSGWPPSDSKDFLGAWGGFAPDFAVIPATYLWRLEIDPVARAFVDMGVAPGSVNVCAEHPLVHPNFAMRKAKNVYASVSNAVGDSTAPLGFAKFRVEDGRNEMLAEGQMNEDVDAWWPGSRFFTGEPLIVPKNGGDPEVEEEAYLLGMVKDAARDRSFVAVFDLERDLKDGPVCKLWLRSSVPHGLHGCFAVGGEGASSVFC